MGETHADRSVTSRSGRAAGAGARRARGRAAPASGCDEHALAVARASAARQPSDGAVEAAARLLGDAVRRGDAPAVDEAIERLHAAHRVPPRRPPAP